MQALVIVVFSLIFLLGLFRPGLSAACGMTMFSVEQMLQGFVNALRSTKLGLVFINAVVLIITGACAARVTFRVQRPLLGLGNSALYSIVALLVWSMLTIGWTPSQEKGMQSILENSPYMVMLAVVCPFLLHDMRTADSFCRSLLLVTTVASALVLVNPEFVNRWGRLGFAIGFENERSNSLALGELGGIAMMTGLLLRDQASRVRIFWNCMRAAGMLIGLILSIRSGSRGQMFFAVGVAAAFFPVAAPVKDLRRFLLTLVGLALLGGATILLLNTLLMGFEAKRFTLEELLYGQSSTQGRLQNVLVLLNEWARNPIYWIFGIGYYAFSSLYSGKLDPYSHVLIADALLELGLPGMLTLGGATAFAVRDYRRLYRTISNWPSARASTATLAALASYYMLLANKQGYLWGSGILFLLMVVPGRLLARLELDPEFDYQQFEAESRAAELQEDELVDVSTHETIAAMGAR